MVVGFRPAYRAIGDRRGSPTARKLKAKSLTLGATRSPLIQVLRGLGPHRERIEARLRDEGEEFARSVEGRRAARLLGEQAAYRRMTEEQKAAWRLEEEVISWLMPGESMP